MSEGFVHSVKVPRIYKIAANIARCVHEEGASLKNLIYEKNHPNVSGIYALTLNTLQANSQLDLLLEKTHILTEQPRLDLWLAKVLITELLWGKKHLKNTAKPILTILSYRDLLQKESNNLKNPKELSVGSKKEKPRYVRVNTLLLSIEKAISLFQQEGWYLLPKNETYSSYLQSLSGLSEPYFLQDFHIPEVLAFPSSISFHDHAGYQNGELILQDKASCLPVHLLNPSEGSVVLDMCASPGMKTTHLAAKLLNNGTIYAVEIDQERFKTLCNQLEKAQCVCVKPLHQDALNLKDEQCHGVRYVLVDPSCSGSGIMNRTRLSDIDSEDNPDRLRNLQSVQVYMLRHALLNFSTVERVIYSTCSIHPEENEEVINEILNDIGDAYRLVPIKDLLGDNWINFGSQKYKWGDRCLYSRPDIDLCNGFFIAMFERNFKVPLPELKRKKDNENIPVQTNPDDEQEKISRKRKKRGKRKNKKKNSTIDEQMEENKTKLSEDDGESEKNDIKKKRKKLKHREAPPIQEAKEIVEMSNIKETKENGETEIKPLKKKKKKAKGDICF